MASTAAIVPASGELSGSKTSPVIQNTSNISLDCTPNYPMLPDEEMYRYKNIYAVQALIPEVMRTVLDWGMPQTKPDDMSYATYCESIVKINSLKDFFTPSDIKKLDSVTCYSTIDTILLFKLIQSCCCHIKPKNDKVWDESDYSKLEPLLWKAKELRNDVCHNIASKATSGRVLEEILMVSRKLLEVAASYYSVGSDELNSHLNSITDTFSRMTKAEEHRKKVFIQYQFCKEGYHESQMYWKRHCSTDIILFTGQRVVREQVYHPLRISIKTLASSTNPRHSPEVASYTKIIEPWSTEEDYNITVVKGEAGSGKSTISKNIAQQFFGLTKREIADLERFDMIHFLECRSRSSKSLESLIRKSYPKACLKAGVDSVMECFSYLGHLMIIDGFDERNECSIKVIMDILEKVKTMPNCQLVFTTRPHAARELEILLSEEGLEYRTCELMPIADEEKQIEFLGRYQETMEGIGQSSEGLIESFKKLSFEVKNFFVFPINLLLYFHIYTNSEVEEFELKSVGDVPRKIIHHYSLFLKRKLEIEGIKNVQHLVEDVLEIIYDFSFTSLGEDKISILSDDIDALASKTSKILQQYGALSDIDSRQILSIVFTSKFSPTPDSEPCFQFFHKSIQEIFASKALLRYIKEESFSTIAELFKSVLPCLTEKEETAINSILKKYVNAIKFVIIELNDDHKKELIRRTLPEFCQVLQKGDVNFRFCLELVSACNCEDFVAQHIASVAGIFWGDRSGRFLSAMSAMLRHRQPEQLRSFLLYKKIPEEVFHEFLQVVRRKHRGVFVIEIESFFSYVAADHILKSLKGAKCKLVRFRACVTNVETVQILSKISRKSIPDFYFSLPDPACHPLLALDQQQHYMSVTVKYSESWDQSPLPSRPLPRGAQPPWLIVENVPQTGEEQVKSIVLSLAPLDKKYRELEIRRTLLSDASLTSLSKILLQEGITVTNCSESICEWNVYRRSSSGACWGCNRIPHPNGARCVYFSVFKTPTASNSQITENSKQKKLWPCF